ncbi:MAG: hypothetical protein MUC48_01960 [Leptolyngbya sp. Prado105]|jgi:hypothetical protein|nr:hypothetical protein [Leptolyngbya sp. Prado105]
MSSSNSREEELRQREKELEERELAMRLRELEAEVNSPPFHQTVKHQSPETRFQRWKRNAIKIASFVGIVVCVIAAVRIASALATLVIVVAIAFALYKVFIDGRKF